MRQIIRILAVAVAAALVTLDVSPAAQAANRAVFTVWDSSGIEYFKQCSDTPPYPCGTFSGGISAQITVTNAPKNTPITLTYVVEGITATPGVDYTGPTTGTVTIPANGWAVWTSTIPIVNDGVEEPNETMRIRLTSSSVGGNFSDTGIGTIYDGGSIPPDCDLFRPDSQAFSMTCTNRPAIEQWQVEVTCGEEWPMFVYVRGNVVTGNGTSSATCTGTGLPYRSWSYIVLQRPAPVSGVIPPGGGTLESPGIGRVTFPAGAFLADTTVQLLITSDARVQQLFDDTATPMFETANRLGYEMRVTTGTVQPLLDPQVSFTLPESFRSGVAPGSEVRILAENYWVGPDATLDTFEMLPDRFSASDTQITATMPRYFFTDGRRTDGEFELTTLAATTPTAPATAVSASDVQTDPIAVPATGEDAQPAAAGSVSSILQTGTCEGSSLSPPLDGPLNVRSEFGPRTHPITGRQTNHGGTDLAAANGTPVKAMADGVVERVAYQVNAEGVGWGHYVVIAHTDGSRTLYAHLEAGSPIAQGTQVRAGDTIANSDSSGGVTGPHLHIEYAPNGRIYNRASKVDPMPCIGANVTGSITVRDNGNLADDAFSVAIDGLVVCTTSIGASNTCAVGNLRPGTKTLTLTAVVAPDNIGTYEITLGSGLTFSDGSVLRSGTIPQGGSIAYSIIVPST